MKWIRFFLFLFLIPNLIYGFKEKECISIRNQAIQEWNQSTALIEQVNKLPSNELNTRLKLLRNGFICCDRAISYLDSILKDIENKPRRKRKQAWRVQMKKMCKKDRSICADRMHNLQTIYQQTLNLQKAQSLYQDSIKKSQLAELKIKECPQRCLDNESEVLEVLNETANLYKQGAICAQQALDLISSFSKEADKKNLKQMVQNFRKTADTYEKEANKWSNEILAKKTALKERFAILKEESKLLQGKGLYRNCYEVQQQMLPIVKKLLKHHLIDKKELTELICSIDTFEQQIDENILTEIVSYLSQQEFKDRERKRRKHFFLNPNLLVQNVLNHSCPCISLLNGQASQMEKNFTLYAEQFYHFLLQSDSPASQLVIKVYKEKEKVHEESIALPIRHSSSWEKYLRNDKMIFIPDTKLKKHFGIDLRISFIYDVKARFSMIISQKNIDSDYHFSIAIDGNPPLYKCRFLLPPPWQLKGLCKPNLSKANRSFGKTDFTSTSGSDKFEYKPILPKASFPVLDQFVEQLNRNPLALAAYVYNEIAFSDPFLVQENEVFQAPAIHRNAYMTFLNKQGSAWEQCQLLVYLLRKAGYKAAYVEGGLSSLSKELTENLLLTKLPQKQTKGVFAYPWVVFFDGEKEISLFPWIKEIQTHEGYDLYNLMPDDYANADRWISHYLKRDEKIFKHVHSDGDDTAGVLFNRFVKKELRKQGLSLADIGVHRNQLKKQFSSWMDFPRPYLEKEGNIIFSIEKNSQKFAFAKIEIFPQENPHKKFSCTIPIANLNCSSIFLRFSYSEEKKDRLHIQSLEKEHHYLDLDETDKIFNVKVTYNVPIGSDSFYEIKTFPFTKGTSAALCFHLGGESSKKTSQIYQQFSLEKDEEKRLFNLLAFVGAAYFEKCERSEKLLASLHKVNPCTCFAFGISKFAPDLKGNPSFPQLDMFWFNPKLCKQKNLLSYRQFKILKTVDTSSNEHQILREIFNDPFAVSTTKLLQIAHLEQQKKESEKEGFLLLTSQGIEEAEKDDHLKKIRTTSAQQWNIIKKLFNQTDDVNSFAYAYLTPGCIASQNDVYNEMGALILHPYNQYAMISHNSLLLNGGLGTPLPKDYFRPSIKKWEFIPNFNSYALHAPLETGTKFLPSSSPFPLKTKTWRPDVRLEYKSAFGSVADPVDIVSGAFYIDEVDLTLLGSFPLEIRRNYNSQNPLIGDFGCGWKLGLNPFLIKQDDKLYAAEPDGTVIVYAYNCKTCRWEVFPEDNPDLCNFNQKEAGITTSPFHAYIKDNILYGVDGSKRFFEDGLLRKWINAKGNILTFSYHEKRLCRIESSNGDFCDFLYNHEDKISEIYSKDGRRVSYSYNSMGDLTQVLLPNGAVISYEYDRFHHMIRETKPEGNVLENIYDEKGRIKEQRSPMGLQQQLTTTAYFDYQEGITTVTDAGGGKTTYKIFEKQIYKITDPLGHQILQSWFIDENSWFDANSERIMDWQGSGSASRSLKSSIDKRGLITNYLYDAQGNLKQIKLQGEDLTGSGETYITKKFIYNDQNLCIQQEILNRKTLITYDKTFSYLPKKIEEYSGNTLISYIDWEYNALGQIEKEEKSGSITLWEYNAQDLPIQKTQLTGTDDPDVVTKYTYNLQGQCIKVQTAEKIEENSYDIMGNLIQTQTFAPSGRLLSANYIGYNLNNDPIWKQTANSQNTLYLDYHACGLLKASRQNLTSGYVAYTLYEYDSRGYLIEEVDPLGFCTYREYSALGKIVCETKEGHSTLFTYEPGGLIKSVTSPSGAKTTRLYTTNGLVKEEVYPDNTKNSVIYDLLGRPIREVKQRIIQTISYEDEHHRIIRTHLKSQEKEIQEFDAKGNLIRFIDAAGYTTEKTYDGLNRLKSETSPSGEQTLWNYQGDLIICTYPSGEKVIRRFEGNTAVESKTLDADGNLIMQTSYHYDPETDIQTETQGDEVTTIRFNTFHLPMKIQKGNITTDYEYDFCGNCIATIDGKGRVTRQTFDGLQRITQKELPDGAQLRFVYDLDSNLVEYHLPNGVLWTASYDSMRRKCFEQLQVGSHFSNRWEYTYKKGYLKETKNPLQHIHTYSYDSHGRLIQEKVGKWKKVYTYDPRGLLCCAKQIHSTDASKNSKVQRSYDCDARLTLESIYLNSKLIQQTQQTWGPSYRNLQIGNHEREFIYRNSCLAEISTKNVSLTYSYNLSGSLECKTTPLSKVHFQYHFNGLPKYIHTELPESSFQEQLHWDQSGKLDLYSSPKKQKRFNYTSCGYLQSAGEENYIFDFGKLGTGVCTQGPNRQITQEGLDHFGRVIKEMIKKIPITTTYNAKGQVISQNQRQFEWDPWGRLTKVMDKTFIWEATYDALGRRLQTYFKPQNYQSLTTTSFYDPEKEFQEIGIKYGEKTFWKIYGPQNCDAVIDETEAFVFPIYNAIGQLEKIITEQGTQHNTGSISLYGPQVFASLVPSDLLSYAKSLNWHNHSQDPTGLIWMGERYYDPQTGRFLSPDPISYPICLDLYTYANNDPINYHDPNGRFASEVYQNAKTPPGIRIINYLSSLCADHNITPSGPYQVGSFNLPNGAILFINGINNSLKESRTSALKLSKHAKGGKIYGIYNATNAENAYLHQGASSIISKRIGLDRYIGTGIDVLECAMSHLNVHTPPVQHLKNAWNRLIDTYGSDKKFLQVCHSGGALHVKNALMSSSKFIQQKIIVVAIAPAAIIPRKLCFRSDNYVSRRDFVPFTDIFGMIKYGKQLHILEPHPNAKFWDHDALSPTFDESLEDHIKNYITNYGGK